MPRLSCNEAKQVLERIRADFGVYKGELDYYLATGDAQALKNIEQQKGFLERGVKELKEGLLDKKVTLEKAKEILGKDFLGPDALFRAFGVRMKPEEIPEIPFSASDLERAKELGQFLILRTDKNSHNQPLTMEMMEAMYRLQFPLFQNDWFKQEDFYTKENSKPGWVLVSKKPIPNSTNQNYIKQTQTICDYLGSEVFGNQDEMPEAYQDAIMEFEAKKQDLENLMQSDWQECAKQLSELQITKLTRQSPADVIHDLLVYKQNNDERLLENVYTWTSARRSGGGLVGVGRFRSDGVRVNNWKPGYSDDYLGASFVRSF